MRRTIVTVTFFLLIYASGLSGNELVLLTGNSRGELFLGSSNRVETELEFHWITDGDFATDKETIATSLLELNEGSSNCAGNRLFDGSAGRTGSDRTYSAWSGGKWASFIIDLKKSYPVTLIQIWSLADTNIYTKGFEVLISDDGQTFVSRGYFNNEYPRESGVFVRQNAQFNKPAKVRFVQVRIERSPGALQQQIGEVAIWGTDNNSRITSEIEADEVVFSCKTVGSGSILMDWSKFARSDRGIVAWKVFSSQKEFSRSDANAVQLAGTVKNNQTSYLLTGLEPDKEYWVGITAVYNGTGEFKKVKSLGITTPGVLDCDSFGDMLAINHYPGGGGSHQSRINEHEWNIVALDMLARTPFKEIRWWTHDSSWVKELNLRGIAVLDWARPDAAYTQQANEIGIYGFSAGNEPDFSGQPLMQYLENLKKSYKTIKEVNPKNIVTAPTVGIDSSSLDWLDKFYAAGAKEYFDMLDIHTYCKTTGGHEYPDGIPAGAPEGLIAAMQKVRKIMAKYGDANKPIISTELGWTTTPYGNPAGNVTREMQADYLVRGLVLSHVLGFKRVYWYAFMDEGEDIYNQEHNFGLVDYYMQAKPSYYAALTLGQMLCNGKLVGTVEGCQNPVYGYVYKINDGLVNVVWNGSGSSIADFASEDDRVQITSLLGEKRFIIPVNNKFRLVIGTGPVYISAKKPVRLLSYQQQNSVKSGNTELTINIPQKVFIAKLGEQKNLIVELENPTDSNASGQLSILSPDNAVLSTKQFGLGSLQHCKIDLPFDAAQTGPALSKYVLRLTYEFPFGSYSHSDSVWLRTLSRSESGVNYSEMSIPGSKHKLMVLSNSKCEISFIPAIGGRIIEIIDKLNNTNQLVIDYDVIDSLSSFTYQYAYWDEITTTSNSYFKNSIFQSNIVQTDKDNITFKMFCKEQDMEIQKIVTFADDQEYIGLNIEIKNLSNVEQSLCYNTHPELMVGGIADNSDDVFFLPGKSELISIPVWLGLGERQHAPLSGGWWAIHDRKNDVALVQKFDFNIISDVRIWFDKTSYNAELKGKKIILKPSESLKIKTEFGLLHGLGQNWRGPDQDELIK